jgi:hypothetical protein
LCFLLGFFIHVILLHSVKVSAFLFLVDYFYYVLHFSHVMVVFNQVLGKGRLTIL